MNMKIKLMTSLAASALLLTMLINASAAAEKDKTIVGEGACAKCILKETKECQHTITVEEGGKPVVYYVTQNHAAKEFGNQLCAEKKKVKATGITKTVGDKHVLTPTKIELAKE